MRAPANIFAYALDRVPDRIAPAAAERFLQQFALLLRTLAGGLDRPLGSIDCALPAERERERGWRMTADAPTNVRDFALGGQSHDLALAAASESWTYAELLHQVDKVQRHLADRGVTTGTVVAVVAERRPTIFAALMAVWQLGAVMHLMKPPQKSNAVLKAMSPINKQIT